MDRPILFRDDMVRAILDGRKTVTRRLSLRPQVGDRLWVRECHAIRRLDYLPFGWRRLSRNLGYAGVGLVCLSWDFRPWRRPWRTA